MIKLSKMTDYAVVILADMAGRQSNQTSAAMIAQSTKLPEPTVSKVLKLLARQNIVSSMRGASGGYSLNKTPEQITMALVITATDGPITLTACVDQSSECCDRSAHCSIKGKWNPVNKAMMNALEKVSLLQMMGGRS